jgi:SM-20-related protein
MISSAVRGDFIKWIDPEDASDALTVFQNAISTIVQMMNRQLYLGIKDSEFHFTVYPPNTRYEKHLDQLQAHDHRRISAILYLNDNWTVDNGGILRLYPPDETAIDIHPLGGQLVCFQSDILPHEVLDVYKDRYSITGWLLDQPKSLSFL